MQPLAVDLLKSSLVGLDVLFGRTEIGFWQGQVRLVLERDDPEAMAAAYRSMSQGSAPGTFYDLLITERNGHQIVENQEPWANEILTTLQVLAAAAVEAITASGAAAKLPVAPPVAARQYPWRPPPSGSVPDRSRIHVYAIECTTCGSRFLLDDAIASAAARRWALEIAPLMIAAGRSADAVAVAFAAERDPGAQRVVEAIRPAAERLGLPAIRLPYNRPAGEPDDRCGICGGDTWKPVPLSLADDPVRFIPYPTANR